MTSRFEQYRRWAQVWRKLAPILLDTAGIILLSVAAILWFAPAAGFATLGLGCFLLNWKHNEDTPGR